jgi:formate/nitrite transporter FocA (FNT family)
MAWASKRITSGELATNSTVVYLAFWAHSAWLFRLLSGHWRMNNSAVGANAVEIVQQATLPLGGFFQELRNVLVCLAICLPSPVGSLIRFWPLSSRLALSQRF